jgi:hypothetical protein
MLQQVLRKKDDPAEGFEWKGQQDYDAVGAAVNKCIGEMLPVVCGLEPIPLVSARTLAATVDQSLTSQCKYCFCRTASNNA